MTVASLPATRSGRWTTGLLLVPFALIAALVIGVAAGHPSLATLAPAVLVLGIAVVLTALARPFVAWLVLATSPIFLVSILLPGNLGLNAFDFLLPPLLAVSLLGQARLRAVAEDATLADPRHEALHHATRRLANAVIAFYAIAALSIAVMAFQGRLAQVPESTFSWLRAIQGLLLFPIGLWWLRSQGRVHDTIRAMLVAGVMVAIANIIALGIGAVQRGGQTWVVNQPDKPIADPNGAPPAMLLLIVLLLVRQTLGSRVRNLALIGVALSVLVMTASRSGLLACLVFTALVLPRARARWVLLLVVTVLAALPFIPAEYWTRLGKTLTLERGSFEAYTSIIRFYGWKAAWEMFLDHPFLGVGYMGFSAMSGQYGDLRLIMGTCESYYLETAAGMGVPGLVALAVVIVRLFQLGEAVRRNAPAGSMARVMASYHAPMLIAVLLICVTGAHFVGMMGIGQMSLWLALMVRSAHHEIAGARPGMGTPAVVPTA